MPGAFQRGAHSQNRHKQDLQYIKEGVLEFHDRFGFDSWRQKCEVNISNKNQFRLAVNVMERRMKWRTPRGKRNYHSVES